MTDGCGRATIAYVDGEQRAEVGQDGRRVFRSPLAFGVGIGWLLFSAANFVDLAVRGTGRDAVAVGAIQLAATAIVYLICLRPRIVADGAGVTVHNPLRDLRAPWRAVERIDTTDAVRLHTLGRPYRCWAAQRSSRARPRARPPYGATELGAGADGPPDDRRGTSGRSRADDVAAELTAMAGRFGGDAAHRAEPGGTATVTWSPYAFAAVGAAFACAAVAAAMLVPA